MYSFLPHTDEIRNQMISEANLGSIEDLFASITSAARCAQSLNLPEGLSELEVEQKLTSLSKQNNTDFISFLGGGTYNRFSPACIGAITSRAEFLTSYTPYQPEISQGSLQVMYEYQSMICNLTGMDSANASVYDGASACAEAIAMACRITKKFKTLVSQTINPQSLEVIKTYCYGNNIEVELIPEKDGKTDIDYIKNIENLDDYASLLVQTPNFLGVVEQSKQIAELISEKKLLFIVSADISSLAVLESPANAGADICVGDVQSLGIPMALGGPHGGFISCKTKYVRQLPGRIVGMTVDKEGKRAFTLTLQAREQHIRREKATSNICSNQALIALSATVYLSLVGYEGLKEVILLSAKNAHYLAGKINKIAGFNVLFNDFLYEFVVQVDPKVSCSNLLVYLKHKNILGGIKIERDFDQFKNCILVATTEKTTESDMKALIAGLKEVRDKYCLEEA